MQNTEYRHTMKSDKDIIVNVYFSSEDRDITKYPSASSFVVDLPDVLTQIHGISISHFKFVPESLINSNNNTFSFTAVGTSGTSTVSGIITISNGNYSTNITSLLAAINTQLVPYNIQFVVDPATNRVNGVIQTGAFATTSFTIKQCRILDILGFIKTSVTITPSVPAVANYESNMTNDTSLIVQIKDVNTISSPNQYAHRASAVLFCSNCKDCKIEQSSKDYTALSQVQYRLQRLNITLLNVYGQQYDLTLHDASFLIHFYCQPAQLGDARATMQKLNINLDQRVDR